jgi:hypothetical protein
METSDEHNEIWGTIIDFTEFDKHGISACDILKTLENITTYDL